MCLLLLAGLTLAACERESPAAPSAPAAPVAAALPDDPAPAPPFDASDMVFEPAEPPEPVVQIPTRPLPPRPSPEPAPLPAPAPRSQAGRCDVRETEGYCFAYTGEAWTPADARAQCTAAPGARFADAACPLADQVATCTFERSSAPGREIVYTYYAPYDLSLAELACPGSFARVE